MNAKEFVKCWKDQKDYYLKSCFDKTSDLLVAQQIASLNLDNNKQKAMYEIIDGILTDTYYSLLLGLDGCGKIGGLQVMYKIYDEDDNSISDCGDIEAEAYEQFHEEEIRIAEQKEQKEKENLDKRRTIGLKLVKELEISGLKCLKCGIKTKNMRYYDSQGYFVCQECGCSSNASEEMLS